MAVAGLALPAAAAAHGAPAHPGPKPAHHKPKPRPKKPTAAPTASLALSGTFSVDRRTITVPGRSLRITGTVSTYAPGQHLTVTATLGRHRISSRRVAIRPTRGGRGGRFVATVAAAHAGLLHLRADHARTTRLGGFVGGRGVTVVALDPRSRLYATLIQQRLAALRFYLPQTGRWGLQTELAIDAYHRLLGRGTSEALDGRTLTDLLDGHGAFKVRYPHDGRHAEGDLGLQLLALIDGTKVRAIYPISSGKSTTPTILGHYQVYRRTPGYLPDGMYYSDFFIRGYAIHGYEPAPDYPASHGCMRLPISDAISVFDWLTYGDWVDVYQ